MKFALVCGSATLRGLFISGMLLSSTSFAGELRCNGSIVDNNMPRRRLIQLCGEPAYELPHDSEVRSTFANGDEKTAFHHGAVLVFDTGSSDFLRIVSVADGRVKGVDVSNLRGGVSDRGPGHCVGSDADVTHGVDAAVVGYLCGVPAEIKTIAEDWLSQPAAKGQTVKRRITTEAWIYRIKGHSARLIIRNGKY